ncbi:RIIB protein [Vibrio phage 1.081.O._10N.286.52.C2]|nr:RIIB protein [Vibrio phage 1.081.O._10N.286.52.C2]
MVNLPIEVKQAIVRDAANGMTQKDNAAKNGTSCTTLRRVLAEHREGKFSLNTAKNVALAAKSKRKAKSPKASKPKSKRKAKAKAVPSAVAEASDQFNKNLAAMIAEPKSDTVAEVSANIVDDTKEPVEKFAYVITPMNVSFTVDGDAYSADITTKNYQDIVLALLSGDGAGAIALLDIATGIEEFMQGHVSVKGGVVKYRNLAVDGGMTGRILEAMAAGDETKVAVMVKFFENLIQNPSERAINELYGFLEATDIELTDDGHFLAFKRVRDNYTDVHSGKFDNSPGQTVWMQRHHVDDNKEQTCSSGLHVCAKSYLPYFSGARVVMCKVNPRDVVSVPVDYNNAKLRCNEYTVTHECKPSEYA